LDVTLDATKTTVDGRRVSATASYGECGDGVQYGISFERDGHRISVRFSERSWLHGVMEVSIDSGAPISVPVPA
jgi:hypothetical protein